MSEMVERVARAIARVRFGSDSYRDEDDGVMYWELCAEEARAAIEAMRELAPAMERAACDLALRGQLGAVSYADLYRAMIDAVRQPSGAAHRPEGDHNSSR
jgi:hypothetical protein